MKLPKGMEITCRRTNVLCDICADSKLTSDFPKAADVVIHERPHRFAIVRGIRRSRPRRRGCRTVTGSMAVRARCGVIASPGRAPFRSCPAAPGAPSPSPARSRLRSSSASGCIAFAKGTSLKHRSSAASACSRPRLPATPFPAPAGAVLLAHQDQTILALCVYGFIASVLPVWMLLCPRDYLSSFLKIGTIALLVIGMLVANPVLPCPTHEPHLRRRRADLPGGIFPFVFICIMCGAISGFHALVASGTTPKMIDKESDIRTIGYGAMLIEGLVGVVALIAAASLPIDSTTTSTSISTRLRTIRAKLDRLVQGRWGSPRGDPGPVGVQDIAHIDVQNANLADDGTDWSATNRCAAGPAALSPSPSAWRSSSRRPAAASSTELHRVSSNTGITSPSCSRPCSSSPPSTPARASPASCCRKRSARSIPQFAKTDWLPGAVLATAVVTAGWGILVYTGSIDTIWPMFGIANQLLAVMALCLVTTLLINSGRAKYAPVTLLPMVFVTSTTMTAGVIMVQGFVGQGTAVSMLNLCLTVFVMASVAFILLWALNRWILVLRGVIAVRPMSDDSN